MASLNLINHRENCRMCLNSFRKIESTTEITETIKKQFYEFTNLHLATSDNYSKFICSSCNKSLRTFSTLRRDLILKQKELEKYISEIEDDKLKEAAGFIKVEPEEEFDFVNINFSKNDDLNQLNIKTEYNDDDEDDDYEDNFVNFFTPQLSFDEKVPAALRNYHCEWCKRTFVEEKTLNSHRLNIHKNKLSAVEVRDIRRKKKDDRKLVCPQCGIVTHYLKDHINTHHLNIKRFFCDHCDYKSFRRCEMKIHMCKHQSRPQYLCDLCGTKFARRNALHVHMNNTHISLGPLTCCFCNKNCKNKMALWQHKKINHSDMAGVKQKCTICEKEILIMYMKKHIRQIHENNGEEMQLCIVCGKMFSKKSLVFHKRIHKDRKFICKFPACTKKYLTELMLIEHEKTHLNQREYKCAYAGCSKSYFKPRVLKMHVALTHENFRENCPVPACKFSVGRRDYMKVHVSKHIELGKDLVESLLDEVKRNTNLW